MPAKAAAKSKPTAEEIKKAKQAAAEKVANALKQQTKNDQAWLEEQLKGKSDAFKNEVFLEVSRQCKETTYQAGKIVLGCPIPPKMLNCVSSDTFSCDNGTVDADKVDSGCKLSAKVSEALKDETTCIDGMFVSAEEGGSHLSPYVPWGPISGKNKKVVMTKGNRSGVTIGTGVDLGNKDENYLKELEKLGVSKETRAALKPLLGKKEEAACSALRNAKQNGPLVFPEKDVELIDLHAMKSRVPQLRKQFNNDKLKRVQGLEAFIAREKRKGSPNTAKIKKWQDQIAGANDFASLTCSEQTILFSTLYHEGTINGSGIDFANALIDGDKEAARKALEAKTKSDSYLIAARGKRELEYWQNNN